MDYENFNPLTSFETSRVGVRSPYSRNDSCMVQLYLTQTNFSAIIHQWFLRDQLRSNMANDPDLIGQETGSISKTGLYHCKLGQETVHDIVAKTTELFNHLKTLNAALQRTPENEAKRVKIENILTAVQQKFETLRRHYNNVNEICSSLAYVEVKSLIPFKDDPDNVEQIQKHRRNLCTEPYPDTIKERDRLTTKIVEKDEQLRQVTNDLRDFIYEINTMLHLSKS